MKWYFLRSTLLKQRVSSGGEESENKTAVIVLVKDGYIVAALDERVNPREFWEAVTDWGMGILVPFESEWGNVSFGMVSSL